ncbi:unnamed protein product [Ectocarpus fasciculatus]
MFAVVGNPIHTRFNGLSFVTGRGDRRRTMLCSVEGLLDTLFASIFTPRVEWSAVRMLDVLVQRGSSARLLLPHPDAVFCLSQRSTLGGGPLPNDNMSIGPKGQSRAAWVGSEASSNRRGRKGQDHLHCRWPCVGGNALGKCCPYGPLMRPRRKETHIRKSDCFVQNNMLAALDKRMPSVCICQCFV